MLALTVFGVIAAVLGALVGGALLLVGALAIGGIAMADYDPTDGEGAEDEDG